MSEELKKPCPFCGRSVYVHFEGDPPRCDCDIRGAYFSMQAKDWNTRPIEAALRAENDRLRNELSGKTGELEECKNGIAFYIEAGKVLSYEIKSLKKYISDIRTKFLESQRVVGELTAEVARLKAALEMLRARSAERQTG